MHISIRRPGYADITATLALIVAMTGTAYAAATIGTSDLKDAAVTTPKIHGLAVVTGKLADGAVTTPKLHDLAITSGKLGGDAVTAAKLAPNAVTSASVVNQSLTLADLKGADVSGYVSFSIGANACTTLTLGVSGAVAGQAALLTWTDVVPPSIVFSPLKVESANTVVGRACNLSGAPVSVSDIGVRLITFG